MAERDGGGSLAAFLLGGLLGGVLGLLLAPKSGRETREDLAAWLRRRRRRGEDLLRTQDPGVDARRHGRAAAE